MHLLMKVCACVIFRGNIVLIIPFKMVSVTFLVDSKWIFSRDVSIPLQFNNKNNFVNPIVRLWKYFSIEAIMIFVFD